MRAPAYASARRNRPVYHLFCPRNAVKRLPGAQLWLLLLFLLFFAVGMAVFRQELPPLCETMAARYSSLQSAEQPFQRFAGVYVSAFVQLSWVLLCAFCAFGILLLPVHFAAKGFFCGAFTLAVYQLYSVKGLIAFWLTAWLPDTLLLLLSLRLASPAMLRSNEIFSWYFLRRRVCAPGDAAAWMMKRYLLALLWAIPVAGIGAGFAWLCGSVLG